MTDTPVSVVVVSRGRPDALSICLTGLSQLQYAPFEVIVVADTEGIAAAGNLPFAPSLKLVGFDRANISAARNLGIAQAAGEIVAFIDDDAVPEPQWLRYLVAPSGQAGVAAMGGFVRGRNGISFQWRAQSLDGQGASHPIQVDPDRATVLHPPKGRAIKTEGTNMAFRRNVLVELGGFDEAFHYFLDETDLNMRLARAGHATAIAPLAEVHHGYAANALRKADRVPRDLFDIGASWAVFQRKHVPPERHAAHWGEIRTRQRRRLLRHMVAGGLMPDDVMRLLRRLEEGHAEGQTREPTPGKFAAHPASPFRPFPSQRRRSVVLSTRPFAARRDRRSAEARVEDGEIVTMVNLSRSALFHRVRFTETGVWVQQGGIFGRSERHQPLFRFISHATRVKEERARIARQRGLDQS